MKYICLVYLEEQSLTSLSPEEKSQLDRDSLAYDVALRERGHLVAAEALQHPRNAVTVRGGKTSTAITDGPFAETKEHLGGFILINAKDRDEATRIARDIPIARYGAVEVRPIYDIPA
jgi:hypothetical protein